MPAAKQTIKQKAHHYIAQHPGLSLDEVCAAVAPGHIKRAETAVASLWREAKITIKNHGLHDAAPKPV